MSDQVKMTKKNKTPSLWLWDGA